MITEKRIGNETVFLCDICGLGYANKATAQECENYCRAHKGSCSAEISQKAVYLPGAPILPGKVNSGIQKDKRKRNAKKEQPLS